jgi:hypothetical protein
MITWAACQIVNLAARLTPNPERWRAEWTSHIYETARPIDQALHAFEFLRAALQLPTLVAVSTEPDGPSSPPNGPSTPTPSGPDGGPSMPTSSDPTGGPSTPTPSDSSAKPSTTLPSASLVIADGQQLGDPRATLVHIAPAEGQVFIQAFHQDILGRAPATSELGGQLSDLVLQQISKEIAVPAPSVGPNALGVILGAETVQFSIGVNSVIIGNQPVRVRNDISASSDDAFIIDGNANMTQIGGIYPGTADTFIFTAPQKPVMMAFGNNDPAFSKSTFDFSPDGSRNATLPQQIAAALFSPNTNGALTTSGYDLTYHQASGDFQNAYGGTSSSTPTLVIDLIK